MRMISDRPVLFNPNSMFRLLILCFVLAFGCVGLAQVQSAVTNEGIRSIQINFTDPSWEKRSDAFYKLLGYESAAKWDGRTYLIPQKLASVFQAHPERENELRLALIRLLSTEDAVVEAAGEKVKKTGKTLGEGYLSYYGDVIAAVAGLKDPRALNALVGAMATGGMADRALAALGAPALDPLIAKFQSSDALIRGAAARALTTMWEPEYRRNFSDSASRQKLKAMFLKAAADEDGGIRVAGVRGLTLMPDADALAVLKKLAESDPLRMPGEADEGGPFYPVRQAAKRALDQIARSGTTTTPNPK
jgi:HEAT repeat protein